MSRALSHPDISIEGTNRLGSNSDHALATSFAKHPQDPLVEVDIVRGLVGRHEAKPGDLSPAGTRVDKDPDDCRVAPILEARPALASRQKAAEFLIAQDGRWLIRDVRRLHLAHRTNPDLALRDQPGEEALKAAVAVGRGRRPPALEMVGENASTCSREMTATSVGMARSARNPLRVRTASA